MIIFGSPNRNRIQNLVIGVTGKTTGTATAGTLVFSATEDISSKISVTGSATFSVAVAADDVYKKHTITLNCPNNQSGTLVIGDKNKIVSLGNHRGSSNPNINLYDGTDATIPTIALNLNDLPSGLQKIRQATALNSFTTTGNRSLPTGITYLALIGNNINWTYSGALPTGITYLYLAGTKINWTYGLITGNATFITFNLTNHRTEKYSDAEVIALMDSLRTKTGNLPATISIGDYSNYASPPQSVIDAKAALIAEGKGVSTINLTV